MTEKRKRRLELYVAAISGDWEKAEENLGKPGAEIDARINNQGETALHIATAANHIHFVKQLVSRMTKEALAITTVEANNLDDAQQGTSVAGKKQPSTTRGEGNTDGSRRKEGNTAFCYAAASGNVKVAGIMLEKDKDLAMIRGRENVLPIYMAALFGHGKMVRYLYDKTKTQLPADDLIDLLVALINADIYDVALEMVTENKWLATKKDGNNDLALHAFARKPQKPSIRSSSAGFWNGSINNCLGNLGKKNLLHDQGLEVVKLLWEEMILEDDRKISKLMVGSSGRLIFIAARQGNVEFLTTLVRSYPDLVLKVDENGYSIFHIAVKHRHEKIFKLIYEIGAIKNFVTIKEDQRRNNILHLAGMLAPPGRLTVVRGAALQLQRELLWFEEVENVVGPQQIEAINAKGDSPRDVFMKQHKGLMKEGELWMRNTANSCMVVATLITTVAFAAAFTVPGGNGQENGIPIFLDHVWFKIFAMSDAVSLIFSASSVLFFLSILTSRYSMEDFRKSLPNKMVIGLLLLFGAVLAMMAAFVAAFFLIFRYESLKFAYSIAAVASVPIILFPFQHSILFWQLLHSTYRSFK